eukprot:5445789-Prymnesium_polylepis.1
MGQHIGWARGSSRQEAAAAAHADPLFRRLRRHVGTPLARPPVGCRANNSAERPRACLPLGKRGGWGGGKSARPSKCSVWRVQRVASAACGECS